VTKTAEHLAKARATTNTVDYAHHVAMAAMYARIPAR
jgi:hypothetical protein